MGWAARPVAMPTDSLRPQAKGAAGFAAASGIDGEIGMLEIADKIILDHEVPLIDLYNKRQLVHVLEDRTLAVVHDLAIRSVTEPVNFGERPPLSDFFQGEVKLAAPDKIDG